MISKPEAGDIDEQEAEGRRYEERESFYTFFSRYLKISGYIDSHGRPIADSDDTLTAQQFEIHLDNVIAFKNTHILAKAGEQQRLPIGF